MSEWKAELTQDDKNKIKRTQNDNPVYKWLIKNKGVSYSEGDILIRKTGWGADKKVEMISSSITMPRKYVVQFVDYIGVPYVRTICANGKLGKALTCIAQQADYSVYEHDPDIADHFLLDGSGDYNPIKGLKEMKKRKTKIRRLNKKKQLDFDDEDDFAKQIKAGTTFWLVDNPQMEDLCNYKYIFKGIKKVKSSWGGTEVWVSVENNKGRDEDLSTWRFNSYHSNIYLEQPICELTGVIDDTEA